MTTMTKAITVSAEQIDRLSLRMYEQGVVMGLRLSSWKRDGVWYVGNGAQTLAEAEAAAHARYAWTAEDDDDDE
jgi:hypothetical protein